VGCEKANSICCSPFARHGKDIDSEEVPGHVFEQARVSHAAHDVLIDAPGLVLLHDLDGQERDVGVLRDQHAGRMARLGQNGQ
jgi:hypothetical protein